MGRAGCSGKVLWMPTACSAKGLPRGLAETVLSRLRAEALQNGSTETRLVFSGNKPLQPFLGWGCGGQAALRTAPTVPCSQPPFLRTPPPRLSLEAQGGLPWLPGQPLHCFLPQEWSLQPPPRPPPIQFLDPHSPYGS